MKSFTNEYASKNILAAVEEGRLVQGNWHHRDDGKELACLLGAIDPKVTKPADCNARLMPMWLADLTPTLFDGIDPMQIYPIARRYGKLVGRWHVISADRWDALLTKFLIKTIDDAVDVARTSSVGQSYWPAVEKSCQQCKDAIQAGGDKSAEGAATAAAAEAAAAARAAAVTAARAAAGTAGAAARAAAEAAWAAAVMARAAEGAATAAAAEAAAYLNLFIFLLDQIEVECVAGKSR
jgi:hypothetical protein